MSTNPRTISIYKLDPRAQLPSRAHDNAVGLDVHAFLLTETGRASTRTVPKQWVTIIPTGIVAIPPPGYYLQCCSRSGLAQKGIIVANAPGIIDPDYTGELLIHLFNGSYETHYVAHQHRIAQLILTPLIGCDTSEIATLPSPRGRGRAGPGSTGL